MKRIVLTMIAIAGVLLLAGCSTPIDPTPTTVTFESAVQTGGTSGTADSTGLTLTFSVDPDTLVASDITITGATKGALSGTGTTRTLAISDITVANGETVSVAIASPNGFTLTGSPQTAVVYKEIVYNLRDTGPAGGLIFYINPNADAEGWKYLEAAPQSTEWTSKQWGKYGTEVGGTGTAIGRGKNNTHLIVALLNAAPADSDRAAQLADALSYGGYDDWFLPSKDELNQMYVHLKSQSVGGFDNVYYWSSSEEGSGFACYQYFDNGRQAIDSKSYGYRVRAVRSF